MPQRNRAPVDVELLLVNLQLAHTFEHLDGKGFVEFNQVHIFDTQSGTLQNLARGRNRPQAHISRINARHRRGDDTSARAQAKFLGAALSHHHQRCRSIVDTRRIAGRYTAVFAKGRLQRGQFL